MAHDLEARAVAELDRLPVDRRRLRRQPRRLDRRGDADARDLDARAPAHRGRTEWLAFGLVPEDRTCRSSASPASTARAVAPSTGCARAPRIASSSRGRCSTASMSMTSPQRCCAAMPGAGRARIYNVTDDEPAPPQDVVAYAAELLHMPPPPEIAFEDAQLSPMARELLCRQQAHPQYALAPRAWRRSEIPNLPGRPARHPRRTARATEQSTARANPTPPFSRRSSSARFIGEIQSRFCRDLWEPPVPNDQCLRGRYAVSSEWPQSWRVVRHGVDQLDV